jgi:hypothetical protein
MDTAQFDAAKKAYKPLENTGLFEVVGVTVCENGVDHKHPILTLTEKGQKAYMDWLSGKPTV